MNGRPVVKLLGGPYHGHCLYADEWETRRSAAERMGGTHNAATRAYRPTDERVTHPAGQCTAWRYAAGPPAIDPVAEEGAGESAADWTAEIARRRAVLAAAGLATFPYPAPAGMPPWDVTEQAPVLVRRAGCQHCGAAGELRPVLYGRLCRPCAERAGVVFAPDSGRYCASGPGRCYCGEHENYWPYCPTCAARSPDAAYQPRGHRCGAPPLDAPDRGPGLTLHRADGWPAPAWYDPARAAERKERPWPDPTRWPCFDRGRGGLLCTAPAPWRVSTPPTESYWCDRHHRGRRS